MRSPARRLLPLGLVLVLAAALAPAVAAADLPDAASVASAEASALSKINDERTARGLVALRVDSRLATLARQRAVYMAETDVLTHTHADGKMVWDLMTADGIAWYGAGEIIAYNTTSSLTSSASSAVKAWLGSPPHKSIMLSTSYNYFAMGLAVSPNTGRRYWAGVFLKGPDRTGAWTTIVKVSKTVTSASKVKVKIRWSGADTKLQVLTSGFRSYQIQRRIDGGAWYDYGTTTATSLTKTWKRRHLYEFRVRARDKAGNWGGWKVTKIKT
jgi:uncharacterized protein YkwD